MNMNTTCMCFCAFHGARQFLGRAGEGGKPHMANCDCDVVWNGRVGGWWTGGVWLSCQVVRDHRPMYRTDIPTYIPTYIPTGRATGRSWPGSSSSWPLRSRREGDYIHTVWMVWIVLWMVLWSALSICLTICLSIVPLPPTLFLFLSVSPPRSPFSSRVTAVVTTIYHIPYIPTDLLQPADEPNERNERSETKQPSATRNNNTKFERQH
ncbi:hypothetical protein BZA05DRAFT_400430 [Tricharina praecox]|uniref:uncharacterized protein n=1 Tax=Tricharina praecox TaxID=43433 RepID=UPI00221E4817|nr:uncharacterized protein BZA05DRAFT_400430 [Tricharina praecox]KAI5849965.1 hypothetical protein BZA05DRAFT_400430 [Tricharina praecox]